MDPLSIPLSTLVAPFTSVLDTSTHVMGANRGVGMSVSAGTVGGGVAGETEGADAAGEETTAKKKRNVSVGIAGCQALGMMLRSRTNLQKLM